VKGERVEDVSQSAFPLPSVQQNVDRTLLACWFSWPLTTCI